jgi:hypothetical protein
MAISFSATDPSSTAAWRTVPLSQAGRFHGEFDGVAHPSSPDGGIGEQSRASPNHFLLSGFVCNTGVPVHAFLLFLPRVIPPATPDGRETRDIIISRRIKERLAPKEIYFRTKKDIYPKREFELLGLDGFSVPSRTYTGCGLGFSVPRSAVTMLLWP